MRVVRTGNWGRVVSVAGVVLAMSLVTPGVGNASQSEGQEDIAAQAGPRLTDHTVEVAENSDTAMWIWSRGNSGYQLVQGAGARWVLVRLDLKSGAEVARSGFPSSRPAYNGSHPFFAGGGPGHISVDEENGRLFVPYAVPATGALNDLVPTSCIQGPTPRCLAGVHVVDAISLEIIQSIPLRVVNLEAGAVSLGLRAINYAPSRGPDDADKLLIVAEELVTWEDVGRVVQPDPNTRANGANLVYALQLDVGSAQQDWVVRIDACRGSRELWTNEHSKFMDRPHPASIMRRPSLDDPAVWVACHGSSRMGMVVRLPLDHRGFAESLPVRVGDPGGLAAAVVDEGPSAVSPSEVATVAPSAQVIAGPSPAVEMLADPISERFVIRVVTGLIEGPEVWWVFDGRSRSFVGTIGVGNAGVAGGASTLDPFTGRLYVLHSGNYAAKGLFLVDVRRSPLSQALVYPEFSGLSASDGAFPLTAWSAQDGGLPAVFVRRELAGPWRMIRDGVPVGVDPVADSEFAGRTLDLEEAEGVTATALDGAARGYAVRAIVMGGAEGLSRVGPADPLGIPYSRLNTGAGKTLTDTAMGPYVGLRPPDPCSNADREVVVGFVGPSGPAVVDGTGSRGGVEPLVMDQGSRADMEAAASRCSRQDWDALWSGALFGRPPIAEPTAPWLFGSGTAECVSGSDTPSASVGDSIGDRFAARVDCQDDEASGFSYARGLRVGELNLGEALSSFRVYRDPARGVVSRIESVARGVSLPGVFRIDTVRGTAESWANGRKQPVAAADREAGYDPNCDFERTAGTCHQQHAFGVWTPGYSCGPCGDEARLVDGLNRALGANGRAAFRSPDPDLARGAENGFTAAVQKPDDERFGDLVLNNDLLQTVVPTLEIIRLTAPHNLGTGRRGQQLYQFAGVEASSSYAITCLLIYDPETNTCAGEKQTPGAIQVSLTDPDGKALAGGAFEVRQDVDADGVLGLKDTLLPNGACVTTDDGVGTCTFEGLQPGSYLVNQVAAPPGYAKSAEPFVVELASGEQRTVAFTNVSNLSTVELKATDENGQPVSGAAFGSYPDPDSDGKVAPDAKPSAECTTGADGACSMQVPAGSYVLVQTSAPAGLEGIEPVAFTFASGGQVAAVTVVNYPPEQPGSPAPEGQASPVIDYSPPVDYSPPSETITDYAPVNTGTDVVAEPEPPVLAQVGDTITQVIRAPGDALRLLARDPKEAVAWTAALALFVLAVMAIRRRQQAIALIQQ